MTTRFFPPRALGWGRRASLKHQIWNDATGAVPRPFASFFAKRSSALACRISTLKDAFAFRESPSRVTSNSAAPGNYACLLLPGEVVDHLSILAIPLPCPALGNMILIFEIHDHPMFMTYGDVR